ncbi:MAG: nitronate monooxygenase [Desulfobacteraceae bacterium]|nr:nitronate monooxygenase [Desulfobacteraceae bacterium]
MNQNRICYLLGIRYPVVQAPMNWVSGAALAAAVSEAGGMGTLGPNAGAKTIEPDPEKTAETMREQIKKVRSLTDKPFAVNVVVGFGEDVKYSQKIVEVLTEEKVPAAIVSVGRPDTYTETLKNAGIKVMHAISTARHAQKAQQAGVDAVICEGYEAGGHKGFTELTTFVLTPLVADAVDIPVVTGGGIGDARGVLAALALGADGIYMGSRFMATQESDSHDNVKQAVVRAKDACTISLDKQFMIARDLNNTFADQFRQMRKSGASAEELGKYLDEHGQYHAQHLGRADDAEICCGQVAGMINDTPPAGELLGSIIADLENRFAELEKQVRQITGST